MWGVCFDGIENALHILLDENKTVLFVVCLCPKTCQFPMRTMRDVTEAHGDSGPATKLDVRRQRERERCRGRGKKREKGQKGRKEEEREIERMSGREKESEENMK